MGSLSEFITVEGPDKERLDNDFSVAKDQQDWGKYYDDCYFYILKAKDSNAGICFTGALKLLHLFYNNFCDSQDE